jgi:hypothetical protein
MTLTLRQINAYLQFSERIDRIEQAARLAITATATQGDKAAIDKMIKELTGR